MAFTPPMPTCFIQSRSRRMPSLVILPFIQCHQTRGRAAAGGSRNCSRSRSGAAVAGAHKASVMISATRRNPILAALLRGGYGNRLARTALGDPKDVAGRLDCCWLIEAILQHRNVGPVAVNGEHVDLAGAVLGMEQLAALGAHAVRTLHRRIHPDLYRRAGLALRIHRH